MTNIRGRYVIDPLNVEAYDRAMSQRPGRGMFWAGLTLGAGAALLVFVNNVIVAVAVPVAIVLVAAWAIRHAIAVTVNQALARELWARDLDTLHGYLCFDESQVDGIDLWVAAGYAEDIEALDEDFEEMANAILNTPEQVEQLRGYHRKRIEYATRAMYTLSGHSAAGVTIEFQGDDE